jgi:predicted transcriptional regulator
MAMTATLIRLPDELIALLDARAAREGVSRAQVIRTAVETLLEVDKRAEIDRQIIEGYTRMPQAGDDLDTFRTRTGLETLRRINEEEGPDAWS